MDKLYQQQREELLGISSSSSTLINRQQQPKSRMDALKTNTKVTETLERTATRMATETQASSEILGHLAKSSQTIQSTVQEHKGLNVSIKQGKVAMNRLERRELTDKFLLGLAVAFFISVVLYIISKRLRLLYLVW